MAQNEKPSINRTDDEITTGRESAADIPNAQVGETVGSSHTPPGMQEQFGDVGNQEHLPPDDAHRRDETAKIVEGGE